MGTMTETKKGCYTCLYMASHEKCAGCLVDNIDNNGVIFGYNYQYLNYVAGDGMAEGEKAEQEGRRNIWIDGELDFNIKTAPEQVLADFQNAAEQCGYLVFRNTQNNPVGFEIYCYTHDTANLLRYTDDNVKLFRLKKIKSENIGEPDKMREVLRSEYSRRDNI